jgi:toxin ParE1/3/4
VIIVWSQFSIEDRLQIFDYIAAENPIAAIDCDEAVSEQVSSLAHFPEIGRPGRVESTRELVISGTPLIVAYTYDPAQQEIKILRVLHEAQIWPNVF